jgi:hypothetical protein
MSWTYHWASGGHAAQPLYNQFQHGSCLVGCGAVAWGMLFGWGDRQAESGSNAYWRPRNGLYRQGGGRGANAVAPLSMDDGVRSMIRELRGQIGTFCAGNSGATPPWSMDGSWRYLSGRTGTRQVCHWNVLGIHEDRLRNHAIASIRDRRTPAIIGTGWLSHYPLAYGYAWRRRIIRRCFIFCWNDEVTDRWFYVNQGWGGGGNDWVEASTWFSGEIHP